MCGVIGISCQNGNIVINKNGIQYYFSDYSFRVKNGDLHIKSTNLLYPEFVLNQANTGKTIDALITLITGCNCCSQTNCGVQIPAGYVGYDFDIPNDYAPATSALNLYLHLFYLNTTAYYYPPATSSPTTPILLAGNQSTIQTFINSCLVAEGFNANDIILIVNSDNTVTVWHSPSYTPNGNEFWMGTIVPDNYIKLFPSIPTTHPTNGNTRAIF